MPTWLIILIVAGITVTIVYCLALWDAKRDCRNCRIAFFIVGEVAGCWLLFNGWMEDNNKQVTFGTILLLIVNLWIGARWFSSWLDKKNFRQADMEREKARDGTGVAVAATAVAAVAMADTLSPEDRKIRPDGETDLETEGGDADVDVDIGFDI